MTNLAKSPAIFTVELQHYPEGFKCDNCDCQELSYYRVLLDNGYAMFILSCGKDEEYHRSLYNSLVSPPRPPEVNKLDRRGAL